MVQHSGPELVGPVGPKVVGPGVQQAKQAMDPRD